MSGFIESYRGAVAAWECDYYGHLNVQFYMARIADATATMMNRIGLSAQDAKRSRGGPAHAQTHRAPHPVQA